MGRLAVLPSITYYGHRGLVLSEIMPFGLGISNDTLCQRDLLLGKLFVWRELSVRCPVGCHPTPGVWSTLKHCCISVVASSFDQTGWGIISEFWLDWVRGVFKGECMGPQFKREQGGNGGKEMGRQEDRTGKWGWAEQTPFPRLPCHWTFASRSLDCPVIDIILAGSRDHLQSWNERTRPRRGV